MRERQECRTPDFTGERRLWESRGTYGVAHETATRWSHQVPPLRGEILVVLGGEANSANDWHLRSGIFVTPFSGTKFWLSTRTTASRNAESRNQLLDLLFQLTILSVAISCFLTILNSNKIVQYFTGSSVFNYWYSYASRKSGKWRRVDSSSPTTFSTWNCTRNCERRGVFLARWF